MEWIKELRRRSQEFVDNIDDWKSVAINHNSKRLIDMNVSQMLAGQRSDGKPIRPEYTEKYAKKKGFSTPNLRVKGLFHNDMSMVSEDGETEFSSGVDYAKYLVKRYTDKIYGISPKNKKDAQRINDAEFIKLYMKWLKV